jgi:hypothetical protein
MFYILLFMWGLALIAVDIIRKDDHHDDRLH